MDEEAARFELGPDAEPSTRAGYFVYTGEPTLFGSDRGTPFGDVTDGLSNTIMAVEAKRDIPWTKPEDLPVDLQKPLPDVGGYFEDGFNAAIGDGSVRFLKDLDPATLRAMITKAGGEAHP